jgi:galactokinase/mevalonate kinase-like predicted kinase
MKQYILKCSLQEAGGWQDQIAASFGGMIELSSTRMEHI